MMTRNESRNSGALFTIYGLKFFRKRHTITKREIGFVRSHKIFVFLETEDEVASWIDAPLEIIDSPAFDHRFGKQKLAFRLGFEPAIQQHLFSLAFARLETDDDETRMFGKLDDPTFIADPRPDGTVWRLYVRTNTAEKLALRYQAEKEGQGNETQ